MNRFAEWKDPYSRVGLSLWAASSRAFWYVGVVNRVQWRKLLAEPLPAPAGMGSLDSA